MIHPPRLFFLLPLLLALVGSAAVAAPAESDPAALTVFDVAAARLKVTSKALRKWQYHQTLTTRQFNSSGQNTGSGSWHSIFRPGEKDPIEYQEEKMTGHLDFIHRAPTAEESSRAAAAAGQNPPTPTPPPDSGEDRSLDANRVGSMSDVIRKFRLRDRFVWSLLPDGASCGEEAHVIAFVPRENQPGKTREEQLFNLLTGRIWISKIDGTVLRAEGRIQSPFRLLWIIARLTRLEFTYESEPAPANRLLRRSRATASTTVILPFHTIRQKHSLDIEKFEPRTPRKN